MSHLNDWNLRVFSGGAHDFDGTGVIHILKGTGRQAAAGYDRRACRWTPGDEESGRRRGAEPDDRPDHQHRVDKDRFADRQRRDGRVLEDRHRRSRAPGFERSDEALRGGEGEVHESADSSRWGFTGLTGALR
eukprot:765966-Hanusia_phi.AAC.4